MLSLPSSCFKVLNLRQLKALCSPLLIILIVTPFLFISTPRSNATSNIVLSISPEEQAVDVGDTFNVTIMMSIPSPYAIAGLQFDVEWNSTVMNATNMWEALFHSVTPQSEWDNIWRVSVWIQQHSWLCGLCLRVPRQRQGSRWRLRTDRARHLHSGNNRI